MLEYEIIAKLRAEIPVPGEEWTYLWRLTVLPGSHVAEHTHQGWTACYYDHIGEGGAVIRGDEVLYPKKGDIIVFPPNVPHAVAVNTGIVPRKSYALTVIKGDNRQVIKDVIR